MVVAVVSNRHPASTSLHTSSEDVVGCYYKLGEGLSEIGGTLAADRAAHCRSAGLFAGFYWFGRPHRPRRDEE
jgi:hypothetical protein